MFRVKLNKGEINFALQCLRCFALAYRDLDCYAKQKSPLHSVETRRRNLRFLLCAADAEEQLLECLFSATFHLPKQASNCIQKCASSLFSGPTVRHPKLVAFTVATAPNANASTKQLASQPSLLCSLFESRFKHADASCTSNIVLLFKSRFQVKTKVGRKST